MEQLNYTLRETNYKFNNPDDFINFKVSFNCDENRDRFYELMRKFCSELTELVEEDQKIAKKCAGISETECPRIHERHQGIEL